MTSVYLTFVAMTAILSSIAIKSGKNYLKLTAFVLFVGLIIAAPMVYFDTLSRPKLLTDETRDDKEVRVLSYISDDGIAVYYWLKLPDVREPRYYYEEWSDEAKKRVEQLQEEMESGGALFRLPFEDTLEPDKKIHPLPQPKMMPKPAPVNPVPEFKA